MSYDYVGTCINCGKLASFREPNVRNYTCGCGDVGIRLSNAMVRYGKSSFIGWVPTSEEIRAFASGLVERLYLGSVLKNRAAGSEAYSCPGSRPESPPRGACPVGTERGDDASTLGTVDAFNAMIHGIEALRDRGKLNEERLRTIVSKLITLIYRESNNGG